MTNPTLRTLVDLRDRTLQKSRVAFGNRVSAVERGADETDGEAQEIIERWKERFNQLERDADRDIAALAEGEPIIERLVALRGVGYLLAAKVVALIDIERADTVSALWRYAGYGVNGDGQRERPVKGEKLHYNARLKTTLYLVATSFLRSGSPYRSVYDNSKEYYTLNRPDWTPGHCHQAAMRKMIKVFLSHLWLEWRTLEGLPTRDLYVMEYGGHTSYIAPQEFGWPIVASEAK